MRRSTSNQVFKLLLLVFTLSPVLSHAQFGRLLKQKLEREVTNMLAEKAAEIIARKAAEKMESEFDKWIRESMEQDSSYAGGDSDSAYYKAGRNYGEFLKGMNDAADLRESYEFDLSLLVEYSNADEDPETMLTHYSSSEAVMAIETKADKDERSIMVIDIENDVTVMFREDKKGRKSAQAIPNFAKVTGSQNTIQQEFTITPIKKKLKVAGYKCNGYKSESESNFSTLWMTEDLGIQWRDTYADLFKKFGNSSFDGDWKELKGFTLKSEGYSKDTPEEVFVWETKEIFQDGFSITTSDYKLGYQEN